MSHHRVKRHNWENGILTITEQLFETLEQAIEYAKGQSTNHIKIYDEDGQVVHSAGPAIPSNVTSYA